LIELRGLTYYLFVQCVWNTVGEINRNHVNICRFAAITKHFEVGRYNCHDIKLTQYRVGSIQSLGFSHIVNWQGDAGILLEGSGGDSP